MRYADFDLLIDRAESGRYRSRVLTSPAGQAIVEFDAPFSNEEIEIFLLRIGRPRRNTRRIDSSEQQAAKGFGLRLYEAALGGEIRALLRSSLD